MREGPVHWLPEAADEILAVSDRPEGPPRAGSYFRGTAKTPGRIASTNSSSVIFPSIAATM